MAVHPFTLSNPCNQTVTDEGGTDAKGNKLNYIRNDQGEDKQLEYFVPDTAQGLTQSVLARLNQSIEAFVYCLLGAQVNVRSSILGNGGRAVEVQRDFLVHLEDAIRTPDISKSVQRYQLAIDMAKVRLDFVTAPGAWLMPSRMVINTDSTVGYNNQLKQVGAGMKLGMNNDVKTGTKKAALHLMAGGPSKINPPSSHPSNPIHKAANPEAQTKNMTPPAQIEQTEEPTPTASSGSELHDCRGWSRWSAILGILLTPLFDVGLHRKGHNSQNQQPGVLGQKTDALASSFEEERKNRSEQAGQK